MGELVLEFSIINFSIRNQFSNFQFCNFQCFQNLIIKSLKIENLTIMTEKNNKIAPFLLEGNNKVGILLLHGWTSSPNEFRSLANYLNSFGYTVFAPLLRGHGKKPEDLLNVTWQDWLYDSQKSLEELKKHTDKIFIVGISMGGNLSLLLSEDKTVAGIITMGAAVKYKFHNLAKLSIFLMGLWKIYRRKYYPPWVRKKMGKRDVYMYYPIQSVKEVMKLTNETKVFLPRVTKPILIMQSTTDHMISKKSPQMIFEGVKSKVKEIFWIENVYHVFVKEKKSREKIGEFIEKILNSKS